MKKVFIMIAMLLSACSQTAEEVTLHAQNGKDSQSCVVEQAEGGYNLTCSNATVFVSNGTNGIGGTQGPPGIPGTNGTNGNNGTNGTNGTLVTFADYTLCSCSAIGNGYYGKAGSNTFDIYSDSSCSGSKVETLNDAKSTVWISSSSPYILGVFYLPNNLMTIQFN